MYPLNTLNTFVICLFGLGRYLGFQRKNFKHNMALIRAELEAPQRHPTLELPSNFGLNKAIGLLSKAKNVT